MTAPAVRRVVVAADDFGLTEAVNRGIVRAIRRGIATSTSLMANGRAFDHAVGLALEHGLDVGVHLTLVEEAPVLPARQVPTLARDGGRLPRGFQHLLRGLARGRIRAAELHAELRAQIERCLASGLTLTHLDSHQHVHVWPSLLTITIALAHEYSIAIVRCPRLRLRTEWRSANGGATLGRLAMAAGLSSLAHVAARRVAKAGLRTTDHFAGMLASGRLNARCLGVLLQDVQPGATELVVHPGEEEGATRAAYEHWGYCWGSELEALTVGGRRLADSAGIQLMSHRELIQSWSAGG